MTVTDLVIVAGIFDVTLRLGLLPGFLVLFSRLFLDLALQFPLKQTRGVNEAIGRQANDLALGVFGDARQFDCGDREGPREREARRNLERAIEKVRNHGFSCQGRRIDQGIELGRQIGEHGPLLHVEDVFDVSARFVEITGHDTELIRIDLAFVE